MTPPGAPPGTADVVLSAESTAVELRRSPRERVRVRREVVTEEVVLTVTVRREVLRVEREPLDAAAVAGVGPGTPPGAGEAAPAAPVLELVLSEERPVVQLEVVPYERVRLGVRSVSAVEAVTTAERREVADVVLAAEGDRPTGGTTAR